MKQAIANMLNGDYSDVIGLFNSKRGFTGININILPHPENVHELFFVHNGKFITVHKETMKAYFVAMLACNALQPYQTFQEINISRQTYKYRKQTEDIPTIETYSNSVSSFKGILHGYHYSESNTLSNVIACRVFALHVINGILMTLDSRDFVKFSPRVIDVSTINMGNKESFLHTLANLDSDVKEEDYVEMLMNVLNSVTSLGFVDDYALVDDYIRFKFKEYKLLLGIHKGVKVELQMPGIYVGFRPKNKSYFIPNRWSYCHPHVSTAGNICLGDFANYVHTNWKDIQGALINIYDLLCTYNTGSPYWRPTRENYSRNWTNAPSEILDSRTEEPGVYIDGEYAGTYDDFISSEDWSTYGDLFY